MAQCAEKVEVRVSVLWEWHRAANLGVAYQLDGGRCGVKKLRFCGHRCTCRLRGCLELSNTVNGCTQQSERVMINSTKLCKTAQKTRRRKKSINYKQYILPPTPHHMCIQKKTAAILPILHRIQRATCQVNYPPFP